MSALRVIDGGGTAQRSKSAHLSATAPKAPVVTFYGGGHFEGLSEQLSAALASGQLSTPTYGHWHHYYPSGETWSGSIQNILEEVGRLTDGWAGEGSMAPAQSVLRDIQTLTALLPIGTRVPSVEVDPSDGEVKLAWRSEKEPRSLALALSGDKRVRIIQSNLDHPATTPFSEMELSNSFVRNTGRALHLLEHSDLFTQA